MLFLYNKRIASTGITIRLFYPTKQIIDSLYNFFSLIGEQDFVKVSFLELTFDFYTDGQEHELKRFFDQYLFMKYNQSEPNTYKTTTYLQPKIKSKGIRIYIKHEFDPPPVLVELMLRRNILARRRIKLRNLDEILQSMDFSGFFDFRWFNVQHCHSVLMNRHRRAEKREGIKSTKEGVGRFGLERRNQLISNACSSYIDSLRYNRETEDLWPISFLNHNLKSIDKSYLKFIKAVPAWNAAIFDSINGRAFLH